MSREEEQLQQERMRSPPGAEPTTPLHESPSLGPETPHKATPRETQKQTQKQKQKQSARVSVSVRVRVSLEQRKKQAPETDRSRQIHVHIDTHLASKGSRLTTQATDRD